MKIISAKYLWNLQSFFLTFSSPEYETPREKRVRHFLFLSSCPVVLVSILFQFFYLYCENGHFLVGMFLTLMVNIHHFISYFNSLVNSIFMSGASLLTLMLYLGFSLTLISHMRTTFIAIVALYAISISGIPMLFLFQLISYFIRLFKIPLFMAHTNFPPNITYDTNFAETINLNLSFSSWPRPEEISLSLGIYWNPSSLIFLFFR